MGVAENKALVLRYMKLIEQGQIDEALALASDDARFWHPTGGESDKAGLRAAFQQFAPLMKSFRNTILTVTAEEDRVAVEVAADIELVNGRHYHNKYAFLLVVCEGKICSSHEYVDTKPFEAAFGSAAS